MNVVKEIERINKKELSFGLDGSEQSSWHHQYRNSAYIFIGGLPIQMTEGDIICIFSQYGEPSDINLVRNKETGKSKGFCFLSYEDQRSTILAVDNLNGIKVSGRTLRVDHVSDYKPRQQEEGSQEQELTLHEFYQKEDKQLKKRLKKELRARIKEYQKSIAAAKKDGDTRSESSSSEGSSGAEKANGRNKDRENEGSRHKPDNDKRRSSGGGEATTTTAKKRGRSPSPVGRHQQTTNSADSDQRRRTTGAEDSRDPKKATTHPPTATTTSTSTSRPLAPPKQAAKPTSVKGFFD